MPAPKGNKFAEGNSGPPPSKYTDQFIEQEAIAFIKWFSNPNNSPYAKWADEGADLLNFT